MRQYEYFVGSPVDLDASGKPCWPIVCRSWDDADEDADTWTRVVSWHTRRQTADDEAAAYNANHSENMRAATK